MSIARTMSTSLKHKVSNTSYRLQSEIILDYIYFSLPFATVVEVEFNFCLP